MWSRVRSLLNHPLGYTVVGGVLVLILWELLKLVGNALLSIDWKAFQPFIDRLARVLQQQIPLGYVLVGALVFSWLFWLIRKRFDRWASRRLAADDSSQGVTAIQNEVCKASEGVTFEMRCIGWKPPTNYDREFPIDRKSRLRFTLTQIDQKQNYTFYFRFWSEGRAPRWIGITNSVGTQYIAKEGKEVSLTETDNARPGIEIRLLDLIRTRFLDSPDELAVIDRFRLRGDAANLKEVIVSVEIWS